MRCGESSVPWINSPSVRPEALRVPSFLSKLQRGQCSIRLLQSIRPSRGRDDLGECRGALQAESHRPQSSKSTRANSFVQVIECPHVHALQWPCPCWPTTFVPSSDGQPAPALCPPNFTRHVSIVLPSPLGSGTACW